MILEDGIESIEALLVRVGASRLRAFMRALAAAARGPVQVYQAIEPELFRFPAIDPASFREAVESVEGNRRGQT